MMLVRTSLRRQIMKPDPTLVCLPRSVRECLVYRGAISLKDQERIHQEWSHVLDKEGEQHVLGSSPDNKVVKNSYLEIYGDKEFTEVKSNQRKEIRRLPGLVWSPTMMRVLESVTPQIFNSQMPNMGRVVEHYLPGYEMHLEHPTVGSSFLYFNLLADTVLQFDDEASGRVGQVFLPAGAIMKVSGEARWGFRFGEVSEDVHSFTASSGAKRHIETDLRLSIQLWRFSVGLLDCTLLQDQLADSLEIVEHKLEEKKKSGVQDEEMEKLRDTKEAIEALERMQKRSFSDALTSPATSTMQKNESGVSLSSFVASTFGRTEEEETGGGVLGGDWNSTRPPSSSLKADHLMKNVKSDFSVHKGQFAKIHGVLEEMKIMQSKGQPVNDMWMKQKITENNTQDAERDKREGYDPNDVEGSWDKVDAKAKFYKTKLKRMDYDGTAFLQSRMPDISQDAPLDMKSTIAKIAPHVKDGEKILKQLPQ